jgi:hypothetical protein
MAGEPAAGWEYSFLTLTSTTKDMLVSGYWDPRMRKQIIEHCQAGGPGSVTWRVTRYICFPKKPLVESSIE